MSDLGEIPAAEDLAKFLRSFPAKAQEQGEKLSRANRVSRLRTTVPGFLFEGEVDDGDRIRVRLLCDKSRGVWNGLCTCSIGTKCGHIHAVGKALLAEHSIFQVNDLSAGVKSGNTVASTSSELSKRLAETVGRPLTNEESNYLKTIHRIYARSVQRRSVNEQDFQELGFRVYIQPWERGQVWGELPEGEYWFWLWIARLVRLKGRKIPGFMAPVTDERELDKALAEVRRKEFLLRWRNSLAEFRAPRHAAPDTEHWDFRAVFNESSAHLECQRPGTDQFEKPKLPFLRDMVQNASLALANMTPEAEVIWQIFASRLALQGISADMPYYSDDCKSVLARLLSRPNLASRTVNSQGKPLRRVAEPLRWTLLEPAADQSDYRLELTQSNGKPVGKLLLQAGVNPVVCLTKDAVFLAPPIPSCLAGENDNRLPAPVIESAEGVGFLRQLGVEPPERIRHRVQTVDVRASIRCRLERSGLLTGHEICILTVEAASEDHRVTWQWKDSGWLKTRLDADVPIENDERPIPIYDDAVLDQVTAVLAPLKLRSDYRFGMHLRVTKAFPETFADWLRSIPPEITVHLDGELASFAQDVISGRVRLDVSETEIDWFDLRVVVDVSDATLTADEIKLLLNAGGAFVRLKGKGWKRLQFEFTADEDEQLARLGLTARGLSAEPQRLHALQLADQAAGNFLPAEQVEKIQRRAAEIKVRVAPDLPAGIKGDLRPYQREGFHFLAYLAENRFGGILADDMGLGKTVQTLAWLCWLRDQWRARDGSPAPAALVVCPKSVMDNWRAEAIKFAPGIRVKTWSGQELESLPERLSEAELHVLNYTQLRLGGRRLGQARWLAAILDEGQYIKNPNSLTAQAARALRAEHKLVLSGTPIENRLLDLWSLMQFAMPGVLGPRAHFSKLYGDQDDVFARRRLAARVRPFLLRRTKSQVAKDLPARIEEDLYCEIEGEQLALYRAELKRAQQILLGIKTQKELAKQQFNFLTALLRLRQICCHPRLYHPKAQTEGAKKEALLDQLGPLMEEGHKVLVFSQFVGLLDLLKPALTEAGWPVFYLAGDTENRGELVAQFQKSEGAAVFLISLKAGGFGLNLTAASYVVLFDPWWNPAVENQAIDRTHRIGQTSTVIAYRLLIKNSIEEKIRQLQHKKSALSDDVLGEEKFAQSLTIEDLHYLLEDT